jgi:hypothetical protein
MTANSIIAWGTFALAIFTACLAYWTYRMAKATADTVRQSERHHQDSFKPICMLLPEGGVDPLTREGLFEAMGASPSDPRHREVAIHWALKNVGSGPAGSAKASNLVGSFHPWRREKAGAIGTIHCASPRSSTMA